MSITKQKDTPQTAKNSVAKRAIAIVWKNFFEHKVGNNAAALAYNLLFALFPLSIFLSNLFGMMELDASSVSDALEKFMPQMAVDLIVTYFDYISHTSNHVLMWFALIFSIWFPMRAASVLMEGVRTAYGLKRPANPFLYTFKQLLYTLIFLVVIVLTLFLTTVGKEVLDYINGILLELTHSVQISGYFVAAWQYLRFLPAGLLMVLAIGTLYTVSLDKNPKIKSVIPGLMSALVSWLIGCLGFSFYVENFAYFSVIYGTLGAVIVLLMWLYFTALVLILGAELNAAIEQAKESKAVYPCP
ncbi:MAG: YihY/virulence factor BrkB family protein [Clostridia bacterium]|nr:YihY/virulence factor BrkB family protein [Clostridia bacterium]